MTQIAIMGESISATLEEHPIDTLLFLRDNPRVYAAIRDIADFDDLTEAEQQSRVYRQLLQEPSVKNLLPEIKRDGGLQEPIVVRWDTKQVIEGNSRLAAYRKLRDESKDGPWGLIRCLVVDKLTDEQQTRLLGQAHLRGRTNWSPYSQAMYCFRWVKEQGNTAQAFQDLSELSGMSVQAIKKNVRVIRLMQRNSDRDLSHFSHYNVLETNKKISAQLKENQQLADHLLTEIKAGHLTAQAMRDQLPTVIGKPKILRKFVRDGVPLAEAFDRARISRTEEQLKQVYRRLNDIERGDVGRLSSQELKAVRQAVRRVVREASRIEKMVVAKLDSSKRPKSSDM